jgi:hypothetical protein
VPSWYVFLFFKKHSFVAHPSLGMSGCIAAVGYFEVRIVSLGSMGAITLGLAPTQFSRRNHHPGWYAITGMLESVSVLMFRSARSGSSYGMHGDDGIVYGNETDDFARTVKLQHVGRVFSAGDVVGCGCVCQPVGLSMTCSRVSVRYVWSTRSVFFTMNGTLLGSPFNGIDAARFALHPTIGTRS